MQRAGGIEACKDGKFLLLGYCVQDLFEISLCKNNPAPVHEWEILHLLKEGLYAFYAELLHDLLVIHFSLDFAHRDVCHIIKLWGLNHLSSSFAAGSSSLRAPRIRKPRPGL